MFILVTMQAVLEKIHINIKHEGLPHPPRSLDLGPDQLLLRCPRGEGLPPGQGYDLR